MGDGLGKLSLRLIEDGLKGSRIDFEEDVAFANHRAFPVILFHDVAGDLRLDLRVYVAVESGYPIPVDGNFFLRDVDDFDFGRWWRRCGSLRVCASGQPAHEQQ